MLQKLFATGLAMACATSSFSQSPEVAVSAGKPPATTSSTGIEAAPEPKSPVLTFSGSVDVYYRYDLNKQVSNNRTSFTNSQNAFALGMASLKVEHKGEKFGAVIDLGFGPRAKEFSYTDEGIGQAIKQMYVSYSPAQWIKLTAGTWATHVGYELVDPQLNKNYSMSYMFTNGPFHHTGVKAELTKGKSALMLGLANATDYRMPPADKINRKFLLAQYSFAATENLKFYLNYVGGKNPDTSKTSQLDLVASAKLNNVFSLGYNGTICNTRLWVDGKTDEAKAWWGSALYLNLDPKPWYGLYLRTEYFSDKNQLKISTGQDEGAGIFATTLSANFKAGGLTLIPEFRLENSSKAIYLDSDGNAVKSTGSVLVAAVYNF